MTQLQHQVEILLELPFINMAILLLLFVYHMVSRLVIPFPCIQVLMIFSRTRALIFCQVIFAIEPCIHGYLSICLGCVLIGGLQGAHIHVGLCSVLVHKALGC